MIKIIIRDIDFKIPKLEVKKELGYQEQTKSNPQIERLISNLINSASSLITAKGAYIIIEEIEINESNREVNLGNGQLKFQSNDILNLLKKEEQVALLTVTIGDRLENKSQELFNQGELTKATILDAIGSTAIEEVANRVNKLIREEAQKRNLPYLTMRYSPGYGDLKLDIQPKLLKMSGGNEIGVITNSSNILLPQKSITALIGLGTVKSNKPDCDFNCINCKSGNCVYQPITD